MSENKQTLFRFKTMRAPKKWVGGKVHWIGPFAPVIEDSVFYNAVATKEPTQTKIAALQEAAETFVAYTSALQAQDETNAELFGLGEFLIKNRKTLTYAEAQAAVAGISVGTLTEAQQLAAWDNLFYQAITLESVAIRETILTLLVGFSFYLNFDLLPETDAAVRKVANGKVLLPNELFGPEEGAYSHATTVESVSAFDSALLEKHMSIAEHQVKAAAGIAALEDVKKYKKAFYIRNIPKETEALKSYLGNVEKVITTTASEVTRDAITGDLIKKSSPMVPLNMFIPPVEVDMDAFDGVLAPATMYLISQLELEHVKTFDQLEKGLEAHIRGHQDAAFEKTSFKVEQLSVNGTLLPKCSLESRYNQGYTYMVRSVEIAPDTYKVLMCLDLGSTCLKIDQLAAEIHEEQQAKGWTYAINKDGILTIDFTGGVPVKMPEGVTNIFTGGYMVFNNKMKLSWPATFATPGGFANGFMTVTSTDSAVSGPYVPSGFGLTRLGIADYRKVEQTLCCYVPGEVSHIENVMAREYKERSTRRLRRSEDTTTISSSSERERQTDTSSTSRYDLQKEVSSVLQETKEQSKDISAHASLSGDLPFASFEIGGDYASSFSSSSSQEMSEKESVTTAQEITEKALDRLVSKVSEERVTKIIEEFEEQNRHGFDNRQGAEHISGVYRWVDKIYKNQIHNYGKRLQYEFMIPEPAAFHLSAKTAISDAGSETPVVKPLDPRTGAFGALTALTNATGVTENNYQQWAAAYGATVAPPPEETQLVSASLIRPEGDWRESKMGTDQIVLPEGYGIRRIFVTALGNGDVSIYRRFYVSVGCATAVLWNNHHQRSILADNYTLPELDKYTNFIPFSVEWTHLDGGIVTVEVELVRKPSTYINWQAETFNAIITAYEDRLADYKDALAESEIQKGQLLADNPAYFRRIENTVLKKNCIAYLIGHLNMGKNFVTGQTTGNIHVQQNLSMDKYAATVKFFEQAFEWEIMDYRFYPFFWGDRAKWGQLYGRDSDDALFRSFLQAGMARTIVTVRPGFEQAVMYYMATGLIWNGGTEPMISDDLYMSIMDELAEPEYTLEESWESRVPSTLTLIQAKTIALNAEGLPCYCDEETPPVETIGQPAVNPLEGLDIFIPGNETEEPAP